MKPKNVASNTMKRITDILDTARGIGSIGLGINTLQKNGTAKSLKLLGKKAWSFAKSEEALAVIQIVAAAVALVHTIEQLRKVNRKIGF